MTTVSNFIRDVDSYVWHSMENFSIKHPTIAKLSSIPLALATFVRDTVATPAKFIEEGFLIGKSITAYKIEKDQRLFLWRGRNIWNHSLYALGYACWVPFSPLLGVIDAIVTLAKMTLAPLRTAKMNAAKKEFQELLDEKHYVCTMRYENGELVDFADEMEFANAAFDRFKEQIAAAQTSEQLSNVHFINDDTAKAQLIEEIDLKKQKFQEGHAMYENLVAHQYDIPLPPGCENEIHEATQAERLIVWREFQNRLIYAAKEEVAKIFFTLPQGS
jgi:hypothetical protein